MLQPPPSTTVSPVVVQAARLPPAAGDPAFSIVRVDPETLEQNDRLDQALAQVPGFSLFRRTSSLGANPTTQGVSLRAVGGSGASRALVTLDGVPQNDPFGGWVIWTALPPETIGGARVVRGAGAGPYGAGALTGTVELQSVDEVPGGAAGEVSAGTLGTARGAAVVEAPAGGTAVFLDGSGETSEGWIPVRQGRGAADTRLTLRDWSSAVRTVTPLAERTSLAGRLAVFEEDRGAGLEGAQSTARGVQASLTAAGQPTATTLGWRLQAWVFGSDLANSSVSVAPGRAFTTPANDQYATPALGWGLNAALRRATASFSWELGTDLRLASGEDREHFRYQNGAFTRDRRAGGDALVAGAYLEGTRTFGAWLLTGGVRLDQWADYASHRIERDLATGAVTLDEHPASEGGTVPTGRVGLRRNLAEGLYVRTTAYAGFRPATLNELHRPFRVGNDVTEANPALAPEKLYGAEAGIGGTRGLTWDAAVFVNRLDDAITNVTVGVGPGTFPVAGFVPAGGAFRIRENAGRVDAVGLEAEASHRWGDVLELRAAADYTDARVDGGTEAPQLTGLRPAETPRWTATFGASWRALPRLSLYADLRYESARFDDDQNTRRLAPGAGVNARLDWRLNRDLTAFLSAENLFDARLETGRTADNVVSYDAPRIVRVGLSFRR